MALTIALDGTIIDSCEAVGSWSRIGGGKAPSLNSDIVRQGTYSLADKSTTQSGFMWDLGASGIDLSLQQIYGWFNCLKPSGLATKALSGIEIYLQDAAGNWGTYEVGGSDTYPGGWQCFTAYTGDTPDNNGGTDPTMTTIRYVGIRWNYTGSWSGGDPNIFMDQMWYGKGLVVTGTGPGDLDEIETADQSNANAYGVLQKVGGVFQLQGLITLGDAGGTGDCYFLDKNQVIAIQDRYKSAHELFGFKIVGNATGTTDVDFGEVVSGVGLSGCVFLGQGNSDPIIEDTDTDVLEANFYGCTFIACGTITFEQSAHEVRNCVFDGCKEITPQDATFEDCTISNGVQTRALNLATTNNVKNCAFNNNTNAVHVDTATTYTFDGLTFSGNTYDVENSSAGAVTINCINGADATTYTNTGGGSTTINNTKTLTVATKNTSGLAIQGVNVRIEKDPAGTLISEGQTNASGEYVDNTYNYLGDQDVLVVTRKKGLQNNRAFDTIKSTGLSVPFTMIRDTSVNLP
jgi:hypothetical protein